MLRFAALGSGSSGNSLLVECGSTRILVDCGFSLRETERRLGRLSRRAEELSGILVTHEHSDHVAGVFRLARKFNLPVWLTGGTLQACAAAAENVDCRLIDSHSGWSIGELQVTPYPVPHDAREPVQFVFSDGEYRLGLLTDAGEITPHMRSLLSGCDALILECNHDAGMLAASSYPPALKRRIAGRFGHLENQVAAELLLAIDTSRLQHLVAAHLSERNNSPAHVIQVLAGALGCDPEWIALACPKQGFDWKDLG